MSVPYHKHWTLATSTKKIIYRFVWKMPLDSEINVCMGAKNYESYTHCCKRTHCNLIYSSAADMTMKTVRSKYELLCIEITHILAWLNWRLLNYFFPLKASHSSCIVHACWASKFLVQTTSLWNSTISEMALAMC